MIKAEGKNEEVGRASVRIIRGRNERYIWVFLFSEPCSRVGGIHNYETSDGRSE